MSNAGPSPASTPAALSETPEHLERGSSLSHDAWLRLRKNRLAASRSRLAVRRKSTGFPCLSMARYKYRHWPRTLMYVSSTRIEPQCGLRKARSLFSIRGA